MSNASPDTSRTPPALARGEDVALDLGAVGRALRRRALTLVVATVLAFAGSALVVNSITPRYAAEARLVLENRDTALMRSVSGQGTEPSAPIDQEAIQSQVQMILSRDIARSVIRDLQLTAMPEFDPMVEGRSPIAVLLSIAGLARDISQLSAEERALEAFTERIAAYPVDRSRVIEIRFQSRDPDLAARVANAVAERAIEAQLRVKIDRDRRARQHVLRTIEDLRQAVSAAENKVQEHRSRFDLLTGTTNQTLGVQTVSELNSQLSAAQGQRADAQARANAIRDMLRANRPIETSEVLQSPVMQRLSEQRAVLRAEIAQQATVLLPGHPRMRELNAQLSDNDAQIRTQAERIARSLEHDARIAGDREGALRRALDEQKRRTAAQGDQEVQLRALEREAKAQRDLLENWLSLYRESVARDSPDARGAEARIVSTAIPSNSPAWPKKLPIIILTTLATLVVGIAVVVSGELLSGRAFVAARQAEPVAPHHATPWVAASAGGSSAVEPAMPSGPLADGSTPAYAPPTRRVLITSLDRVTLPDALMLGASLASTGRTVVVVETDHRTAGDLPGMTDVVTGQADLAATLQAGPVARVHLVPYGRAAACDDALLTGAAMATVLAVLDAAYDHVLVNAPPLMASDLAAVIAETSDRVVLVADEGPITRAALEALRGGGMREVLVAPPLDRGDAAMAEAA